MLVVFSRPLSWSAARASPSSISLRRRSTRTRYMTRGPRLSTNCLYETPCASSRETIVSPVWPNADGATPSVITTAVVNTTLHARGALRTPRLTCGLPLCCYVSCHTIGRSSTPTLGDVAMKHMLHRLVVAAFIAATFTRLARAQNTLTLEGSATGDAGPLGAATVTVVNVAT